MPDDRDEMNVEAHIFEGPLWDDPEEAEPEAAGASADDDEDDVEAHASGFS